MTLHIAVWELSAPAPNIYWRPATVGFLSIAAFTKGSSSCACEIGILTGRLAEPCWCQSLRATAHRFCADRDLQYDPAPVERN